MSRISRTLEHLPLKGPGYDKNLHEHINEIRSSRHKYREEIESTLMSEAKNHAIAREIEKKNDILVDQINAVRRNIQFILGDTQGDQQRNDPKRPLKPEQKPMLPIINSDDENDTDSEMSDEPLSSVTYIETPKTSNSVIGVKRRRDETTFEVEDSSNRLKTFSASKATVSSSRSHKKGNSTGNKAVHQKMADPPSSERRNATHNPEPSQNQTDIIQINGDAVASIIRRTVFAPRTFHVQPRLVTTRSKLCAVYGGCIKRFAMPYPVKTRPSPDKVKIKPKPFPGASSTNHRYIVFPNGVPELSEHFPAYPGDHGLMFGMKSALECLVQHPEHMFELFAPADRARLWDKKGAKLSDSPIKYYGSYKVREGRMMTGEEFRAQTGTVQGKIASKIAKESTGGCMHYLLIKARIACGKEGEDAGIDSLIDTSEKIKKNLYRVGEAVTSDKILQVLRSGKERIPIFILECVRYDTDLADAIIRDTSAQATV